MAVDQASVEEQVERIAKVSEMTPQISAGSITNAEFLDQSGIEQTPLLQIAHRFRMAMELELVKRSRLLRQSENRSGRQFLFEIRHSLAERQIEEELNKADQVTASTTAVAIEEFFAALT